MTICDHTSKCPIREIAVASPMRTIEPDGPPDPHGRDTRRGQRVLAAEPRQNADGSPDKRYGPRDPTHGLATTSARRHTRSVRRGLAAVIRDRLDPELVYEWLAAVWLEGRVPPMPEERRLARGDQTDDLSIDAFTPPTVAERMRCLEILLLRGFGQPTTHVVLDAEVRALVQVDHGDARARLAAMAPHKRRELLAILREVAQRAVGGEAPPLGAPDLAEPVDDPAW